jgi:hypothetical protein
MTPEDGLPFRPERQLAHPKPDKVQTGVTFVCVKRSAADYETFLRLEVAHNLHRYLEARKTFKEFTLIGREISIFVCGSLK